MRWYLPIIFLLLLLVGPAWAADHVIELNYDEPTTTQGGGALNDLAKTRIYFTHANGDGWITPIDVTAASENGGAHIQAQVTVVDTSGQVETGLLTVTAIDRSGNESIPGPTAMVPVVIDSEPPASASNVTATVTVTLP